VQVILYRIRVSGLKSGSSVLQVAKQVKGVRTFAKHSSGIVAPQAGIYTETKKN